jgi:hypothetical protein
MDWLLSGYPIKSDPHHVLRLTIIPISDHQSPYSLYLISLYPYFLIPIVPNLPFLDGSLLHPQKNNRHNTSSNRPFAIDI